ncbi:hypothetical protein DMN91_002613 [Ooceraea biroi]|uniref:Uncharacterized protein n=1 Tax=Ooceraea biroi TaxID=2015173 RepID=A0A026X3K1_OOCBI|nr:hypothetical protein X777_04594 [Ooceraea biroi]RLU24524.1 hypothetical protein DMN91_002613 [Ooceraea biroi]
MEIVLENPSPPSSTRTPTGVVAGASSSVAISQLGLPIGHPSHHFPHRTVYDAGLRRSPPLLPAEDYYARTRHGLPYGELDGASAPVTVRRVDKSGLLEIAETDPVTCPRPCVLTGAEDVAARAVSLRVDRSGLLEAVPEVVDQPEEHCNNGGASNGERATSVTAQTATRTSDEDTAAPPRGATLKVDVNVNPRVFEGGCLLERPSSLEGQACPDEVDARVRSADVMVLTGSPRTRYDVSKAAERLSHLPFSPGLSLRRLRSDPPRVSPLSGRRADADSALPRNQKSPEFAAKYTSANVIPRKLAKPPHSPKYSGCSKGKLDPASTDSGESVIDKIKTPRESLLLAKGSAEQENDLPGEERAEAEGCEHTTVESLEEDKVSFKGSNKLLDNDNVQTLRVIILSEQL